MQLSADEMCTELETYQEKFRHNKNLYVAIIREYYNNHTRWAGSILRETIEIGSLEDKWFWLDDDTKRLANSKGVKLIRKAEQGDVELLKSLKQIRNQLIDLQDYYEHIELEFGYQKLNEVKALENKFLNDINEIIINNKIEYQNLKAQLIGESDA